MRNEKARHRFAFALLCITLPLFTGCGKTNEPAEQSGTESKTPVDDRAAIFRDVTDDVGLKFTHQTGATGGFFFPEIMGGGAAFLDFNRDGRLDIFLVNGATRKDQHKPGQLGGATHRLFKQTEDGKFEDVTQVAGFRPTDHFGMGACIGDVNNDGYPDIVVTAYGPDTLYLNQRDGSFRDVTKTSGLFNPHWGTSATFVDYDRDGRLDLFIANYVDYRPIPCTQLSGVGPDYCAPHAFPPTTDKLFRNVTEPNGKVRFEDVSATTGIARRKGPGLGVVAADFNGDHRPDLYVANDQAANFLWINRPDGTFEERAVFYGVANGLDGTPQAGMGIALGDINRDGRFDLLVTHLTGETNALYIRTGPGGFVDRAKVLGLGSASYPMTGFGTALVDLDLNGKLDVLVANGGVKRPRGVAAGTGNGDLVSPEFWNPYRQTNQIFLGRRGGRQIEYRSRKEPFIRTQDVSRALIVGDVDNDGDPDVLVTNIGESPRLFRNNGRHSGNWLLLSVRDPNAGDRFAYGAVVEARIGESKRVAHVNPGTGYLSSQDPRVHLGLEYSIKRVEIAVRWPDGTFEDFGTVAVNRHVTLRRGKGKVR